MNVVKQFCNICFTIFTSRTDDDVIDWKYKTVSIFP